MVRIDVDAARAARREASGDGPVVLFGGREFSLPAELPFPVIRLLGKLKTEDDNAARAVVIDGIMEQLFDGSYEAFCDLGPSLDDLLVLLEGAMAEYGVTPGEPPASESS